MHRNVPKQGLNTLINNRPLQEVAQEVVAISMGGLQQRARIHNAHDESAYLAPLAEIARADRTHARQMIEMVEATGSLEGLLKNYQVIPHEHNFFTNTL
jgi:glutamate--cysteine ligase